MRATDKSRPDFSPDASAGRDTDDAALEPGPPTQLLDGTLRALLVTPDDHQALSAPLLAGGIHTRGLRRVEDAPGMAAAWKPHLALVDVAGMGAARTVTVLAAIRQEHPCAAVLLADTQSTEMSMLAAQCNADVVLTRPLDVAALRRLSARESTGVPTRRNVARTDDFPAALVGSSAQMLEVWRLVMLAAGSSSSVVVTGETGAGKEVVTRALHRFSSRRSGPFVAVNCAALPDSLLESELFGHERGAFTGAAARHKGRFELAHGGTLFLDEIGDLPLALQVKLLRVLQERTFERLGGTEPINIDVRVVAATHRNLSEEVRCGRFRADLFYRLSVLSIQVPPLRERRADILPLWNQFLEEGATRAGQSIPETSEAAQRLLLLHDWPGNIRELQNAAQHALMVTTHGTVLPADLPESVTGTHDAARGHGNLAGLTMADVERLAILDTYESLGSVRAAATMLDVSERKLHYRLRQYEAEGRLVPSGRGQDARAQRALDQNQSARRQLRILLAEDDDDVRWALSAFLRGEGYDVVAVADGKGVLEQLGSAMLLEQRASPADVIITDLRMPGLTGMQILESVHARQWNIPVVLITAFGDDDTRERAHKLGAAAFLSKPIDVAQLQRLLNDAAPAPAQG